MDLQTEHGAANTRIILASVDYKTDEAKRMTVLNYGHWLCV